MIREFREFVLRGNVVDLAVAVIIGAAFTTVVDSLVTTSSRRCWGSSASRTSAARR